MRVDTADPGPHLQFGLCTGKKPQVCITTTPGPIQLLKQIGHAYVLDDVSGVMAPNNWAKTQSGSA